MDPLVPQTEPSPVAATDLSPEPEGGALVPEPVFGYSKPGGPIVWGIPPEGIPREPVAPVRAPPELLADLVVKDEATPHIERVHKQLEQLTGLIPIRFLKHHEAYNAGEVAGFEKPMVDQLVAAGIAKLHEG